MVHQMGSNLAILLAIICYTSFSYFVSKAGSNLHASLSATIFNGLGALGPLLVYILFVPKVGSNSGLSASGIVYSALAGISIAIFSVLLITALNKGGLAYAIPLIYGGTIALSSLVGVVLLRDSVTPTLLLGVGVICIGTFITAFARGH